MKCEGGSRRAKATGPSWFALILAGGVIGCGSDDADDQPNAEGAFSVIVSSVGTGGMNCTLNPHNTNVGGVDAMQISELMEDGRDHADISCTVEAAGGGFNATGTISVGASTLTFAIGSIDNSASEASPALGDITYRSVDTIQLYQSPPEAPCEFHFVNDQEIAPGRLWVQFQCPQIANASLASSCAIVQGSTIAMQSCLQ